MILKKEKKCSSEQTDIVIILTELRVWPIFCLVFIKNQQLSVPFLCGVTYLYATLQALCCQSHPCSFHSLAPLDIACEFCFLP